MRFYWPIAKDANREPGSTFENLFTYSPADTLEQAKAQFKIWRDNYGCRLKDCQIQVMEDGKIIEILNHTPDN